MKKYWIMNNKKKETHIKNIYENIIFTGKKENGLYCHTPLIMEEDLRPVTTKNKFYEIVEETPIGYAFIDDEGDYHEVTHKRLNNWFRLVK